ncbi:hypothetical protein XEUV354_11850 [Xanthomonas euvesicatoria]|nr:hypothetical protein BHE83_08775 [Xanthomonas euvesicatoria pv. vesicatoria str. 85-10]APO89771.1 hypothetical protein BJD11_06680 [Xanthomonas euvesicatoria]TVS45393.1 hypothetical protein E2P72_00870 [Xanthomonas perforans]KHL61577.1 hypothetical protein XEU66b_10650 [Xanthomonas euvesicatoria]KHL65995.1 hypothetical protein XEU83M_09020 [Xanthomonas euvesicatoria]
MKSGSVRRIRNRAGSLSRRSAGIGERGKRHWVGCASRGRCRHGSSHRFRVRPTCHGRRSRHDRHSIGSIAHLLRNPFACSLAQWRAQCVVGGVALRKTCLHGRALCSLRLFGLRCCGSKQAGHGGRRFKLQGVLCRGRCSALGFCLLRGVCKPGIHRRGRGMQRQRTQQGSKAIMPGKETIEGRAHGAASRLTRSFAKA